MKYKDFTLLIQGPLNETSLSKLQFLKSKFDKIIISCWNSDNQQIINNNCKLYYDELIINTPKVEFQDHSPRMQIQTVWAGLMQVKTKYVIKMRSDEYYTNFDYMYEMIRNNPYRIFTGDYCFSYDTAGEREECKMYKYAVKGDPSDHLYGGRTDQLIAMLELMNRWTEKGRQMMAKQLDLPIPNTDLKSFEHLMFYSVCYINGEVPKLGDSIKQMQKYFGICPVEKMGEFHIHRNHGKKEYNNVKEYRADRKSPFFVDEVE